MGKIGNSEAQSKPQGLQIQYLVALLTVSLGQLPSTSKRELRSLIVSDELLSTYQVAHFRTEILRRFLGF